MDDSEVPRRRGRLLGEPPVDLAPRLYSQAGHALDVGSQSPDIQRPHSWLRSGQGLQGFGKLPFLNVNQSQEKVRVNEARIDARILSNCQIASSYRPAM